MTSGVHALRVGVTTDVAMEFTKATELKKLKCFMHM